MVGNLEVAWGVVGRTCRDVVARREGEVLGSWGGKSVVALPVPGDSLLGHRSYFDCAIMLQHVSACYL